MSKQSPSSHPLVLVAASDYGTSSPPKSSTLVTSIFIIGFLICTEFIMRFVFDSIQDLNPVLADQIDRHILARHIGVDTLACFICASLGWNAKHLVQEIFDAAFKGDKNAMKKSGIDKRSFSYEPLAFRLCVFFFAYQIKNLYDTIVWGDGPEYIMHHVLSLAVAWGAMYPSYAQIYSIFFFGISEVSTAVLCILANFDDDNGVKGLGDEFPILKVSIGVVFVILFIICRCILWPVFSYYFVRDSLISLKSDHPMLKGRVGVIKMNIVSLSVLTVLQLSWLVLIGILAHKEFKAIGLI
mmetsp:Transcript_20616/g.29771  ORF Transcript_20616/g.29771 Transcript_20616/m.29771 type:complete len:298 (+) Transcript_20616:22-915(+)